MPVHKFRIIALLLWGMAPGALAQNLPSSSQLDEIRKTPIRNEIRRDANTFDPKENKGLFDKFDALKQQLDQDLRNPRQVMRESIELYELGKYQDAIDNLTWLINQKFELVDSFYFRGVNYEKLNEYQTAIDDYDQAISLDPNDSRLYASRGNSLKKLGNPSDAEADYLKVLSLKPSRFHAYVALNNLGDIYYAQKKFDQAFILFDHAVEIDSERFEAFINRGKIHGLKGNCPLAIQDFSKGIALNPNVPYIYKLRAYCYEKLKKDELATADFEKAVSLEQE